MPYIHKKKKTLNITIEVIGDKEQDKLKQRQHADETEMNSKSLSKNLSNILKETNCWNLYFWLFMEKK